MNIRLTTLIATLGVVLGVVPVALTPADALNRERQILSGGFNQGPSATLLYTAPGWTTALDANYPNTGDGENAAQLRMPAGTLSRLRVRVRTQNAPTSGTLTVMVRINGANSTVTCSVSGTGNCNSPNAVAVPNNGRFAIQVNSTLADEGNWTLTYTLEFD